jgi:hypothetical protein
LAPHTKAGAVENVDEGYKDRNVYIYSLCHSETAIKALDNYQTEAKLAERNRVQFVRVSGQGGTEGSEIARVRPERSVAEYLSSLCRSCICPSSYYNDTREERS